MLSTMTWCNQKSYQEVVPNWRELSEISVGHDIYEFPVGLHLPYAPPLSTWVLVLGTDVWPRCSGRRVRNRRKLHFLGSVSPI